MQSLAITYLKMIRPRIFIGYTEGLKVRSDVINGRSVRETRIEVLPENLMDKNYQKNYNWLVELKNWWDGV